MKHVPSFLWKFVVAILLLGGVANVIAAFLPGRAILTVMNVVTACWCFGNVPLMVHQARKARARETR